MKKRSKRLAVVRSIKMIVVSRSKRLMVMDHGEDIRMMSVRRSIKTIE